MVTTTRDNSSSIPKEMGEVKRCVSLYGKVSSIPGWTKPENWMTYDEAKATGSGVGFVLGDGWACLDFDNVIAEDGSIPDEVRRIVERLDSYTEVSMSGKGLHVFFRVDESPNLKDITGSGKVREKAGFESYFSSNRYIAVTGNVFEGYSEIRNATSEVLEILTPIYGTSEDSPAKTSKHWSEVRPDLKRSSGVVSAKARAYTQKMAPAIQGEGGSVRLMGVCAVLSQGFLLNYEEAWPILEEYNERCEPPFDTFASSGPKSLSKKLEDSYKLKSSEHEPGSLLKAIPIQPDPFAGVGVSKFAGRTFAEIEHLAETEPEWLVNDMFSIGQPVVFGAPKKNLKTTLLVDLAVSLATGTPWMGTFEVPKPRRVLLITGESSERSTAQRTKKSTTKRGLTGHQIGDMLRIEAAEFPKLPRIEDCEQVRRTVAEHGIEVVILDPLYMGMTGDINSGNIFEMGDALKRFKDACQPADLILSHHIKKTAIVREGVAPDLDDLSGSGVPEFAGSFFLMGRLSPYQHDGIHDLSASFGGREEQSGTFRLKFNEKTWTAEKLSLEGFHAEKKAKAEEFKMLSFVPQITEALQGCPEGVSLSSLAQQCGTKKDRTPFSRSIRYLVEIQEIEEVPGFVSGKRPCKGYRLASGHFALSPLL